MTAPPLFNFSEAAHLANVASFLSPASTASDSGFSWTSMASGQGSNRPPSQPRNMSPPSNGNNASSSGNDLLFITGNTPADFKTKKNMTKVRKKAMGSYLEKEKKPRDPTKDQQQRKREGSAGSRTSAGSEPHDVLQNSEAMRIFKGEKKKARKQVESTTRSTHEPNQLLPEMQMISATPRLSVDFVLPSAPIVLPMRTGVALPYDGFSPRPFLSIGKPLDPFRAMFQASHPRVSVEELKWYCSRSFGTRAMGMHWIPTLVKSPHAFLSTLCIASAHYDAINERPVESVQTLALRQEVVHLIGQNLVNPSSSVDDYNVIALTQLIASELISGERTALNFHEKGVEAMVQKRGGVNQLGVNGRLASTLSWVSLESAILHEAKPRSVYSDFCASSSTKNYPNTATIPESPLFCPRAEFETLRRSSRCTPRAMDLLKDIRMMMDIFLHETKQSRQNLLSLKNIYKKITTQYPSAAGLQKTNVLTPNDWKYEAIRVASIITATAIMKRIPFSSALTFSAEVETPNLTPLYTSSNASGSNESLTSPNDHRHDSAVTTMSTNSCFETSPAFEQPNPFAFTPNHQTRPSFSSTHSSEPIFFPAPQAPAPSGPAALLTNLKIAIENSDLSDCWGDMAGVLLWVALTVGAASRESNKLLKKWYAALAVRVSIVLCFEHPEAIHSSLLRMGEVVECVGYVGSNTEVAKREPSASGSAGKRRRV